MKILLSLMLLVYTQTINAYEVVVRYVYDGDSIMIILPLPKPLYNASIRLKGIDTPEINGKCQNEKMLAKLAKQKLKDLIADNQTIVLYDFGWDKYGGRINARVNINGEDLSQKMIDSGLARPYAGGARGSWCK